jgi:hypothetical protein
MKPVVMNATNITGKFAAAGKIAFGAVVQRSAAGEVKASLVGTSARIGVVVDDAVEKDVDGFYSDGDPVSIITGGTCRVWMVGGVVSQSGDYVKILPIDIYGNDAEYIGICTEEATATTATANTIARIIGDDVGDADDDQLVETTSNSGQKVITMDATKMTAIGLVAGDYILVSDEATGSEVQMVDSVSATTITCKENLVFTYTAAALTIVYKLVQADVELM